MKRVTEEMNKELKITDVGFDSVLQKKYLVRRKSKDSRELPKLKWDLKVTKQ